AELLITPGEATVALGSRVQLVATAIDWSGATVSPSPRIQWSSSNTTVARVATNGSVAGQAGGGPVTVTATVHPNGPSASAEVTVIDPGQPDRILIEPDYLEMMPYTTAQLTATVLNAAGEPLEPPVQWRS